MGRRVACAALLLAVVHAACGLESKVRPRLSRRPRRGPTTRARGAEEQGAERGDAGGVLASGARRGRACARPATWNSPPGRRARAGMQGGQHPDAHVDGFVLNSIFVHLERADGRVQTHRRMMQFDDHPHLDPSVAPEQVQSCSWALAHGACRRR